MFAVAFIKLSFITLIVLNVKKTRSEDIIGCGGFVKSDVEINFSLVEVSLYTKQGSLKYNTDCSPTNGYYMLPVYNKGEYSIKVKGPPGWTFEPESVEMMIDGVDDVCTTSKDINFIFTGFGVVGKVLSKGKKEGPKGVMLSLEKSGKVVGKVMSEEGGEFTFEKVLPGSYSLKATHPLFNFSTSRSKVIVDKGVGLVENDITVAGYPLKGRVLSNKTPISGVHFLLYKKVGAKESEAMKKAEVVQGCGKDEKLSDIPEVDNAMFVCHVTSGKNGVFKFVSVMSGDYVVIPLHQSDTVKYELQPKSLDVSILHDSLNINDAFVVSGFGVSGVVKLSSEMNTGMGGVVVMVDDVEVATTSHEGIYHLEGMQTATYHLSFRKEHYIFQMTKVNISPTDPRLPHVYPHKFEVCGKIILADAKDLGIPRKVIFSSKGGVKVAESQSDEQGVFCTFLPSATFIASVETTEEEVQTGFKLMPLQHTIHVTHQLINDVTFSQFLATVRGVVKCLDVCGKVRLILSNLQNPQHHSILQVTSDTTEVQFVFDKVMTGSYEVKLDCEERCWQNGSMIFTIIEKDIEGLTFKQTGVIVQAAISVPATLHFKPIKDKNNKDKKLGLAQWQKFKAHNKVNRFCIDTPGRYEVVVESCHKFEQQQYFHHTSDKSMLLMKAVSFPVSITTHAKPLHVIHALVKRSDGGDEEWVGPMKMDKKKEHEGLYEYETVYWSKQRGESLEVTFESDVLLFHPKSLSIQVDPESCPSGIARVEASEGVFVEGSVTPALSGVGVQVIFNNQQVFKVKTDARGIYKVGPVEADLEHRTTVWKKGYNLVASSPDHFNAFKLAEIVVNVRDSHTEDILHGVLISLSGNKGFRRNNVTGAVVKNGDEDEEDDDGGQYGVTFSSLDTGNYFLKPMMKEYIFQPSSQSILLKEGATEVIDIRASRIAYSCYGRVSLLGGEAEGGIYMEAMSIEGDNGDCRDHQEESKSEMDGSFRIRGLKPGCRYNVGIKTDNNNTRSDRTSPKKMTLKVERDDIRDVRFVVFKGSSMCDVTGRINTHPDHLFSLKVHIYSDNDLDSPLHVQSMAQSPFFYFSVPIGKTYTLRLTTTLKTRNFHFQLPEHKLHANQAFQHLIINFQPKIRRVEQELKHSSFFILPFTIILIFLFYNHTKVLAWLTQQLSWLWGVLTSPPSTFTNTATSVPQEGREELFVDVAGKKKLKARKI